MFKRLNLMILMVLFSLNIDAKEYSYEPGEKRANIYAIGNEPIFFCKKGELYFARKNKKGYLTVPSGSRIDLHGRIFAMSSNAYASTSFSSTAKLSFIPDDWQDYMMSTDMVGNQCIIDLVKIDKSAPVGLAVLDTIKEARGCGEK